jgi:hypothetical protein
MKKRKIKDLNKKELLHHLNKVWSLVNVMDLALKKLIVGKIKK